MSKKKNLQSNTLATLLNKKISPMIEGSNSYLIVTCNNLHQKELKDFEIEDLRIMIGQSIGLKYLIPLAIEVLEKDILAEGDFYEGDLLKAVLTSEATFWKREKDQWKIIINLFKQHQERISTFDTTTEIIKGLMDAFGVFERINV